jgi:hypothetical protein
MTSATSCSLDIARRASAAIEGVPAKINRI